jgi:hypothetical protein
MNNPTLTMLSAQGASDYSPTSSLDLPPALASILSIGSPAPNTQMSAQPNMGMSSSITPQQTFIPQYQQGGMIGPGGMPQPTSMGMGAGNVGVNPQGGGQGQPMDPQMLDQQLNQFVRQHPEQIQQIQKAIMAALQSGSMTQEELNMAVQLATVAAQNPEMYQYVRQFAIQQGLAGEQDLSPTYDQGLIFIILLAARAAQSAQGGQNMLQGGSPAMAAQQPMSDISASQVSSGGMPSMGMGGKINQKTGASEPIVIEAHTGEYVIPKHVVDMKGKEFFDNLVEKYKGE